MKMNGNFLKFMMGFCSIAAIVSCSKDSSVPSYEEVQKETYEANFIAKYGPVASNQTWDFSTYERQLATRSTSSVIKTEIMEKGISFGDLSNLQTTDEIFPNHPEWNYVVIKGGVEKNGDLLEAISTVLPEKKKWEGDPAVLVAPANSFYIYPLFSGGNIRFDLKVKVGDTDPVTVFKKDYTNFQTINGMKKANGEIVNMKGIKIEAPVGTPVEIYLDNLVSLEGNKINGTVGTTNGQAVYVDIPEGIVPELEDVNLKENAVVKYIGIEDDTKSGSDRDYNDVVIAVVGNPNVPQKKIITNKSYEVKVCRAKRYLIEDLGSIGDFDFNDIVVDVEENTVIKHKVEYENGVLKSDEVVSETSDPTKAVIRAMGGTIDFELVIGNTSWSKSGAGFNVNTMYNTQTIDTNSVLAEFEVTGWNPELNNVSVKVNGKDGQVFTIGFPKTGTVPMIIAVDPSQDWMKERTSVPSSWFYLPN
jgi:hypothetical protein